VVASPVQRIKSEVKAADIAIGRGGRAVKRTIDIVGSCVLLVLMTPLIIILGILVRTIEGSPVLHRRRVIGPKGEFDAFKLRTMLVGADEVLRSNPDLQRRFEVSFKLQDDPRVTRLGALLRKASLDELPQLWNVLRGQMSLVGPRMITPAELEKYGEAQRVFRQFKAGLTGYWQIHGRQATSYAQRVEMDLFYARHWSLFLDLEILAKTPLAVFRGAGAY
jgi:lipopolysaccharide/colanic/teichoic acid biosynthesis glycosyltransferase